MLYHLRHAQVPHYPIHSHYPPPPFPSFDIIHRYHSLSLWTTPIKCPRNHHKMTTKCPLGSFSPWLWAPSLMVVTQDRGGGVLHGVTGHQSQLRSGHCCTCTASCKACPPVVPAIAIPMTCNLNHALQQFKGISITASTPAPFGPDHRVNIAMNSSLAPAPPWTYPQTAVP